MKQLKEFTIQFVGLKEGKHHFDYKIDQTFFDHFDYEEFNSSNINVDVTLNKKSTLLELHFEVSGTVNVNCDVTNEPYDQPISNTFDLVVKFGEEYNDENIDILIVLHGEYEINIQQYIYETIVLAIPSKLVHPGVEDGTKRYKKNSQNNQIIVVDSKRSIVSGWMKKEKIAKIIRKQIESKLK
jgi:uncharacterized metal-binding protein YceD (DUF177 family)